MMTKEEIFDYISSASGLLPVFAFIYNYRHLDGILKLLGVFFILAALSDALQYILPAFKINSNPVIHIFVVINIFFFGVIFYRAFFDKLTKRVTLVLLGLALAVTLYYCRYIVEYPTAANTASSIAFILLSLVYFYQLLSRQEFVHIEKQGLFWFNAAVLFYFSINIFLFMLIAQIPVSDRPSYYIINNITNIIANLLYSIALLCRPQKTT